MFLPQPGIELQSIASIATNTRTSELLQQLSKYLFGCDYVSKQCRAMLRAAQLKTITILKPVFFQFSAEEIPGSSRQQSGVTTAPTSEVVEAGAVGVASATSAATASAHTIHSGRTGRVILHFHPAHLMSVTVVLIFQGLLTKNSSYRDRTKS